MLDSADGPRAAGGSSAAGVRQTFLRAARLFDGRARVEQPTVVIGGGRIAAVEAGRVELPDGAELVDFGDGTLLPGLIDSHVHPVAGDWTPRQNQLGWIDSFLHGGVTTMISAGEVHTPGRPRDVIGLRPWPSSPSVPSRPSGRAA